VFSEVKRVLTNDGTLWVNIGDSYAGSNGKYSPPEQSKTGNKSNTGSQMGTSVHKPKLSSDIKNKDLIGIPWMLAFALRADGWYLRQEIVWSKPSCMPESVRDRCTRSKESIFLLSKSSKYYYDFVSIQEKTVTFDSNVRDRDVPSNTPGRARMNGLRTNQYEYRNKRDVWNISTKPYKEAHFAVFPPELPRTCILAGCPTGGVVLDPFSGSGTTAEVAYQLERSFIGIELNPDYIELSNKRLMPLLAQTRLELNTPNLCTI
jgi:DNA modification methylase